MIFKNVSGVQCVLLILYRPYEIIYVYKMYMELTYATWEFEQNDNKK